MYNPFSLILSHRFGVFFYTPPGNKPNMLDIRFQKVSGIGAEISLTEFEEGGENQFSHRTPRKATHGNLIMERGIVTTSALKRSFNEAFNEFRFAPADVLVMMFDDKNQPSAGWQFHKVIPVKWTAGKLNADSSELLIETMELSYAWFRQLDIPYANK